MPNRPSSSSSSSSCHGCEGDRSSVRRTDSGAGRSTGNQPHHLDLSHGRDETSNRNENDALWSIMTHGTQDGPYRSREESHYHRPVVPSHPSFSDAVALSIQNDALDRLFLANTHRRHRQDPHGHRQSQEEHSMPLAFRHVAGSRASSSSRPRRRLGLLDQRMGHSDRQPSIVSLLEEALRIADASLLGEEDEDEMMNGTAHFIPPDRQ